MSNGTWEMLNIQIIQRERERERFMFRNFSTYSLMSFLHTYLSMSLCVQSFLVCTTSTVIVLVPYTQLLTLCLDVLIQLHFQGNARKRTHVVYVPLPNLAIYFKKISV